MGGLPRRRSVEDAIRPISRGQSDGATPCGALLLLDYVCAETELRRGVGITSRDNVASQRIAQKCGFRFAVPPREDPVNDIVHIWDRSGR